MEYYDIKITGRGLFKVQGASRLGRFHLADVAGFDGEQLLTDDGMLVADIALGARDQGMIVELNGVVHQEEL